MISEWGNVKRRKPTQNLFVPMQDITVYLYREK